MFWRLILPTSFISFSASLTEATFLLIVVRFRQWLSEGLVCFTYLKKDNSIRDARGTLCPLLIPDDKKPKGEKIINHKFETINYYDINRSDWRSFDIRLFIGYVELYPMQKETEKRTKKE